MTSWKSLFLFTLITQTCLVLTQDAAILETLQLVQILFRHGQRVPEYPYPTDPYNSETFWKEGWGQLTEEGKKQEYQLGQYLRNRYKSFVSENYVANEMYILSSDLDRTIMSAQLLLAGMFPTVNGTEWNPDLHWQPIPVHTIATEQDNMLRNKRKCPKYQAELNEVLYNSPELMKINTENAELFQYLSNYSGVNITNINQIDGFYATMLVEEGLGLEIPEWAVPVIHTENFQRLYKMAFAASTSTPQLKRFRTGPLLDSFNSHFHEKITNSSMKTKFFMYSAHDTTLVNVLNTFQVLDLQIPTYSSVFMMELHKNPQTGAYFVNFFYRNETDKEPYKMQLPNCTFDCPYEDFKAFVGPIIPENWDQECLLEPSEVKSNATLYIIAGAGALIILAFVYCIFSKVICKRKRRVAEYERF